MSVDAFMRKAVFIVAGNSIVSDFFRKHGMKLGVNRFVAAESLEDTVDKVKSLQQHGLMATLDFLGESVSAKVEAQEATDMVMRTLDMIHHHGLDSNVSVKLTQLGLLIDPTMCLDNMERLVALAQQYDNFVRIDMEDSSVTEQTLQIFKSLYAQYGKRHVGIVIQSYLYRSEEDIAELERLGANVRIVKGAYKESPKVAFPDKKDVDANYLRLVKLHLQNGCYTAIATHDERIIEHLKFFMDDYQIPREQLEFQMLYGISSTLQKQLAAEGYRVRVYTPYGEHWYPYFTRRIAERPANLWFVLKGITRR